MTTRTPRVFMCLLTATAASLGGAGCSKSTSADGAALKLNMKVASTSGNTSSLRAPLSMMDAFRDGGDISSLAPHVGMSGTSDIEALKYMFFGISVCETMTTSGSGFSSPTNCLKIYDSGTQNDGTGTWGYNPASMNPATMGQTVLHNESALTNLMDATSRSALTQNINVTAQDAHSYNWGFITWYPVIAAQGQVTTGSAVLRTKSDGGFAMSGQNTGKWVSGDLTSGTAGEALVNTGNGGTWFRFQNPLVITADDVTNKSEYTVDLAFNPDAYFKGVDSTTYGGCGTCAIGDAANNWMTVPMLDVTAIPHKSSQRVMRETYLATVTGAHDHYQIRLQLYYLEGDANKTIYGVNTNTLTNDLSTTYVYDFPKVSYVATNGIGKLDFKLWDNETKLIQNFTRGAAVGDTSTATINCGGNTQGGGFTTTDCADGANMSVAFTLVSSATFQ